MNHGRIHVLDENTANKIAAGEVVERPASIVKELVENALDAGSHNIEVEIAAGGIEFIRVTDDGCGMIREDAELAILRHATSKIHYAEDLTEITSLGFRGEALPSIASVAKFSLTTRPIEQDLATYLEISGGSVVDVRETGAGLGTTITVTELFFNTPARRKFLKTPQGEGSHIHDILVKLALSHPEVCFKLTHNGKLVLSTPGNDKLTDTLASLYGQKILPDLLSLDYIGDGIQVTGYIGKPTLLKSSRLWQTLIVNDRIVNSRMISKALDNAYHSLLPKNGYPLAVVHIGIPATTVDVNVHPQKSEIKFSDEQKIFRAVFKAITSVLEAPHSTSQVAAAPSFLHNWKPPQPALWRETAATFTTIEKPIESGIATTTTMTLSDIPVRQSECIVPPAFQLLPLGQIAACYIVAQGTDGLYLIDQHAAHERILYDRLSRNSGRIPSQQLLTALYLEFDRQEIELINAHQDDFHELGFTLEQIEPLTMRLLEIPIDVPTGEAEAVIREALTLLQGASQQTAQALRHACLQTAACRAAVKAGETLNMRQLQALLEELCTTELPYTCPHGRPAIIRFSDSDLAKLFKRT